MSDRLRAAFALQSQACADLGSPFMGQLCRLLGERLSATSALTKRLFDWKGDVGPRGDSVPLRLCGALHALRLSGDETLGAVYPPHRANDDALWQAVAATLANHAQTIDTFINSPPQTNEVRRASALITAAHVIADHFPNPLRVSELGASAGLNLNWDQFALCIGDKTLGAKDADIVLRPDWRGPMPKPPMPHVVERRGVDLNPVDPATDSLRLRAYHWPDQPERMALTTAALALPHAPVDQADAVDWLAARLPHVSGQTHIIYTTIAWQYFPPEKQQIGLAMIEAAGANATQESPLAFVQMENDGGPDGAALTLRLWPDDLTLNLGRVDFHGRWVNWTG